MGSSPETVLLENSSFHNPVLNVSDANKKQSVNAIVSEYILSKTKVKRLKQMFAEEMKLGLQSKPLRKSCFYMINTFVTTDWIDGTECGDYLAIDIGGSNCRVVLCRLKPDSEPEFRIQHYGLTIAQRQGSRAEKFFDLLAQYIGDFIGKQTDLSDKRLPLGFTFSFGFDQLAIDKSVILQWGIQTNFPDANGKCAVQLLRDAIARQCLNVDVVSISNDITTTLMYGMFLKTDTYVSYILGSGMNAAYIERVDCMEKLDPIKAFGRKLDEVIVNIEAGFMGDDGAIDFVKSRWDLAIDDESMIPHSLGFEKLIGGFFIGELVRRTLVTLAKNNVFIGGHITDCLSEKFTIKGPDVSAIETENLSKDSVIKILQRLGYNSSEITTDDIEIVRYVSALISVRNAQLIASTIAAIVERIDKPLIRVAFDGSLYKYHPKLHTLITDFIAQLVPINKRVELFLADDGSGKGGALVAAMAAKTKQFV